MSFFKKISNKLTSLKFFFKKRYFVAQYKIFSGDEWLQVSIESIINHVDKVLIVFSETSWGSSNVDKDNTKDVIDHLLLKYPEKVILYKGRWDNQLKQVQDGLDYIKQFIPNATHCLYIDSDEIYDSKEIAKLLNLTRKLKYFNKELRVSMRTYFKTINYIVYPDVAFKPMALFPIRHYTKYVSFRNGITSFENVNVFFHHLSFVRRDDKKIKEKFLTHQFDEDLCDTSTWYEKYWENFHEEITNFHPSNDPAHFQSIKKIENKEIPKEIKKRYEEFKHDIYR